MKSNGFINTGIQRKIVSRADGYPRYILIIALQRVKVNCKNLMELINSIKGCFNIAKYVVQDKM